MKQNLLKTIALGLLAMVGTNAWADDWTLDNESYGRTNLSESTYSWNSGWPKSASSTNNTFNCNIKNTGMFVLQKYTVNNLAAVKSLTLKLTCHKDNGVDALAIWSYGSSNPWPTSSNVADVASAVNTIVGVSLNTTTGNVNTPLKDGATKTTVVDTDYRTSEYTISGDQLTILKNAADNNTFVLLITNKTSEIATSNTERKLYSSGHTTESYRPSLTVTYDKAGVYYSDGTKTNYSSFEAARSAVASAEQDATITVMEDQNITSRVNAISGKTISIVAGKNDITLTNTMTNSLSFLANSSNAGTLNVGSADHTMIIKNSSTTTNSVVEVSGGNAAAIVNVTNVTFKDISSSSTSGLMKTNNSSGKLTLKDVTFDGCTVSATDAGIILCNANGMVTLSGNLTFTNCTGHNFRVKGRMEESSFTPSQVMTIYNDGIGLSSSAVIKMAPANTTYYSMVNADRCLVGKGNSKDEELVVSEAYTLSVSAANAATLIIPFATTIPDGVSCYTLTYSGGENITATPVTTTLSANTPVLVTATGSAEGTKYKFNASTRAQSSTAASTDVEAASRTSGVLIGNYTANCVVPANNYILTKHGDAVGFRKVKEGNTNKVQAYRAYMTATYTPGTPAPEFLNINLDGNVTAIDAVEKAPAIEEGEIYNLQGVRMTSSNLPKGIYVKNGKKFIVK